MFIACMIYQPIFPHVLSSFRLMFHLIYCIDSFISNYFIYSQASSGHPYFSHIYLITMLSWLTNPGAINHGWSELSTISLATLSSFPCLSIIILRYQKFSALCLLAINLVTSFFKPWALMQLILLILLIQSISFLSIIDDGMHAMTCYPLQELS